MSNVPKVLLIQARIAGDPMQAHELSCFMQQTQLPREAFRILNVATDPIDPAQLEGIDVVMVGGSGDFSFVQGGFSWREPFLELLCTVIAKKQPMFGSCFGFQGIVICQGGSLTRMDGVGEIGTFDVSLTPEGQEDTLFGLLPPVFKAQLGHNDMAVQLPNSCTHLASSALARYQAIRVKDAPIVATQFHPELDHTTNFERFVRYIANYKAPHETTEEAIERTSRDYIESPECSTLLSRFLKIELDYDPT